MGPEPIPSRRGSVDPRLDDQSELVPGDRAGDAVPVGDLDDAGFGRCRLGLDLPRRRLVVTGPPHLGTGTVAVEHSGVGAVESQIS